MPAEARAQTSGSMMKTGSISDTLGHKSVLDKQRAAIEKLRAQNEQLKHDLLLENKFSVRPGDPFAQSLINSLQDEGDNLARKIVLEMRKTRMLDQQLGFMGESLTTTRSLMGGINTAKEQSIGVQKRIKLLENRLEKAAVKYNSSITHNKALREQINNLRRERIMFESIHANLERELAKLKRDMADTIAAAQAIHELKERAVAEMGALMAQAEREQQGFEDEWRALTQIIEDDKRERERVRAAELALRERETQELLKSGIAAQGLNGPRGTSNTARKGTGRLGTAGTGAGAAANKALAQNVAAEKVQMYGQAFEKIQAATGIEDIDALVAGFIGAEDQNYTLFNYVNEVNTEVEKLEDQTAVIRGEIGRYRDGGAEVDRTKVGAARDVEERLAAVETQAEVYEKRLEAASNTVNTLKSVIWELFARIGCNTPAVRELLGDEGGVSEANVLAHLGIIEQRTNELLQSYALRRAADPSGPLPPPAVIAEALVAQPLTSASPRIIIDPPSTSGPPPEELEALAAEAAAAGEAGELGGSLGGLGGEGGDEKPLTREALESRVAKTLTRRLETAIKVRPPGADTGPKRGSPTRR
uniref:ODAD1 central coiled coil region domain-containing protein n=1 Tax=Chlamydomonas leiostraca TaxID=1034604 RepID=A0A7S0RLG2_9CHLO|mmetsp:Transcript_26036/g.66220  ORF Transcript_26036/g.66220 Transcript_26036/m.66220 type:complete len:590 (+) Transcript_26036:179-1948(+)|eukprot:CAMPEP_0202859262 /NCGR_PEP_ID=MMETSP1391-20130828/1457_1 /ASSEMBLY_ACC=CAM_ASM_000867 /TAXON_ID=1034604 /ORGANISM="Chlamydomonas leiostraca, Strain SAG 11-49" /LENGTH=589 /DNA_ID=CAMNT_0049538285 /DNA_START=149 /DNA_END=1918 /DNA_ORIENTATION=+